MKNLKKLFFLIWILSSAEILAQTDSQQINGQAFDSFEIYFEGFIQDPKDVDISYNLFADFKILKEKEGYFGISRNNLFEGAEKVADWKVLLSKDQLGRIENFLETLNKTEKRIDIMGYNNSHYIAKFKNQEWYIKVDKNVFSDFGSDTTIQAPDLIFYQEIFSEQIQTYFKSQKKHKTEVDKMLTKKWFYSPSQLNSLKQGSQLKFVANSNNSDTEYWEIQKGFLFSKSSDQPNKKESRVIVEYNAEAGLTDFMYLSIYQPNLIPRVDLGQDVNHHTSFYIISLTEKELILEIAF